MLKPFLHRHIYKIQSIYLKTNLRLSARNYQWKVGVFGYKPGRESVIMKDRSNLLITKENSQIYQLISAYREHGHKIAQINPLAVTNEEERLCVPELDYKRYSLCLEDKYNIKGLLNTNEELMTVKDLIGLLETIYCKNISAEFTHIEDVRERDWFASHFEAIHNEKISSNYEKEILTELIRSQELDKFLGTKFVTLKRYSCEGAESQLSFFMELFRGMSKNGGKRMIIASHHRGRLNLLTGLLHMPPELIFRKVKGKSEFNETSPCTGDVISHLCHSVELEFGTNKLQISLTKPPSHLEAVCPVSVGETRAWQLEMKTGSYSNNKNEDINSVINVQVHGDAALMGQGVSQESIIMSQLPHFNVDGVIHLVVNNQLGFTTPAHSTRGTKYCTDISKIIAAPVVHVNGDYPNEVIKATRLAVEYQRKFKKSIFIDLNCFRRWGHNEVDDPTYTNPLLYNIIHKRRSVPDLYAHYLISNNVITKNNIELIQENYKKELNEILSKVDQLKPEECKHLNKKWDFYEGNPKLITEWDTGVDINILKDIGVKSVTYPENYNVHPNIIKAHVNTRIDKLNHGVAMDWGTAETLAFGTLIYDGFNVRISGQDIGRGTFSHRHVMLIDQITNDVFIPLNNLYSEQSSKLEVVNSLLSEEAVLGFEFGFSTVSPHNLVIWEAQFGDFFNGAQIQIDTYVSAAEAKWNLRSGIVMLLPHGYDGAGPEHSSSRMERFLQLTNSKEFTPDSESVNINIVNPTTPAQYFHLLRRQMVRNYRKPLIVIAPKILLRLPAAVSTLNELGPGTSFQPVIGEKIENYSSIRKLIFVSGKHYYALQNYKHEIGAKDTAIIRVEELTPFPVHQLSTEIQKYKNVKDFVWSQEEPQNMGAWTFCKSRFENLVGCKLRFTGREPSAAPAVGIGELHQREAKHVIEAPFASKYVKPTIN